MRNSLVGLLRGLVVLFALSVVVATVAGCPPNSCFVKVCSNGNCHCPVNNCGEGADFDLNVNTCVCQAEFLAVAGRCLTQVQANEYCGKGSEYKEAGCVAKSCPSGQSLDASTGECQAVAALASNLGVTLKEGETLGCAEGQKLVVEGDQAACVPLEQTCARDEVFDGKACVKAKQCPTGSIFDASSNGCVTYAEAKDQGLTIDVQSWANANYGRDKGTPAFCGSFARSPHRFGISEGQSATVRVNVTVDFPNGEISPGKARTEPSFENSSVAVPQRGAESVQAAAEQILAPLRAGGGKASAPSATTSVKCIVTNAAKPAAVPASGGA